jgi:hypothetical protein
MKLTRPTMDDQRTSRENRQNLHPVGNAKKLYQKPAFRHERVFETLALSCGKIGATIPSCQFSRKTS